MELAKVQADIRRLYGINSAREGKYVRNMNRYMNNGVRRESVWTMNVAPQAYVTPAQGVEGTQTQLNLIKSATDSIVSRISQANVRPHFMSLNGNYDTTSVCVQAQHFFDIWTDEQHAYPKSVMCFRDACVYDMGVMHVNPLTKGLQRVAPWEYFIDPAEYYHGAVTRAMHLKKYFPLAQLVGSTDNAELKKDFESDPFKQGEFATYYDLYKGEVWQFFDDKQIGEPVKIEFSQYGGLYRRPFVEMYYTKPMRGFWSVSLADDLYPIQRQIDELVRRLDQATRKALLNTILVPNGSGMKASNLENGVTAYNYNPGADGGSVTVLTPPAVNPQFIQLLDMYLEKGYQMIGMSQLSAQSQKPAGLDSGKALQTMENIESDRFNTQLQQFTHFLVDVSRVAIDVFPKGDQILPADIGRGKLTWGDLRDQRDLFSVQFSAANALSKDPQEKREEIEFMIQKGIITESDVGRFYQQPDLERVYTLANSSAEYVEKIIDNAIRDGDMDYAETVDLQMLKSKSLSKLNQLMASGDDAKYVDRLTDLLQKVLHDIQNVATAMNPQVPPPPANPSASSLDAGQIKAMSDVVMAVSQGMPPASARALLGLAFPAADPAALDQVIQGATPQQTAPMVQNQPALGGA